MRDLIRASSLDLASRADVLLARHAIILLGEQEHVTNLLRTSVREATLDIYLPLKNLPTSQNFFDDKQCLIKPQ